MLFFETKLDMSNEESVNAFYLWNGAVYVTPLIGKWSFELHDIHFTVKFCC